MDMNERCGRGSAAWVRQRLVDGTHEPWLQSPSAAELIDWLELVARNRSTRMGVRGSSRAEVVQEGMALTLASLGRDRLRIAENRNPAAALEHAMAKAVSKGRHRERMAGLGGVSPNGRGFPKEYPRVLGGDDAVRVIDSIPMRSESASEAVEAFADRIIDWCEVNLGVRLAGHARDGIVYVLDRMVAGSGRVTLVRGGHSGLVRDPAMHHLGFTPLQARHLGVWLLGPTKAAPIMTSLIDVIIGGEPVDAAEVRWLRSVALNDGFGVAVRSVA